MRGLATAAVMFAGAATATAHGADIEGQVSAGIEVDTNPLRIEQTTGEPGDLTEPAPAARTQASLGAFLRPSDGTQLRLSAAGAARKLAGENAEAADATLLSVSGAVTSRMGESSAAFLAEVSYQEAFERGPTGGVPDLRRDYRTLGAAAGVLLVDTQRHSVTARIGFRDFAYKPSRALDHHGPWLSLSWNTRWQGDGEDGEEPAQPTSLELRTSYLAGHRDHDILAFTNVCPSDATDDVSCFRGTSITRSDLVQTARLELVRSSDLIWSAGYQVQWDASNSFGESLLWHKLTLAATLELPGQIIATMQGALLLSQYLDPLFVAGVRGETFRSIEDDNRNTLTLHGFRELSAGWGLEARYTVTTNELSRSDVRYRRHLAYGGLLWRFDP